MKPVKEEIKANLNYDHMDFGCKGDPKIIVYTTRLEDMATLKHRNLQRIRGRVRINKIIKESIPVLSKTITLKHKSILNAFQNNIDVKKGIKTKLPIDNQNITLPLKQKQEKKPLMVIFYYNKNILIDVYDFDEANVLKLHTKGPFKKMDKIMKDNIDKNIMAIKICCSYSKIKTVDILESQFSTRFDCLRDIHKCHINRCMCCCKPQPINKKVKPSAVKPINITSTFETSSKKNENDDSIYQMSSEISIIVQQVLKRFEGLRLEIYNGVVGIASYTDYLKTLTNFEVKILNQILVYAQKFVNDYKISNSVNMIDILNKVNKDVENFQSLPNNEKYPAVCQILKTCSVTNKNVARFESQQTTDATISSAPLGSVDDIETTIPTTIISKEDIKTNSSKRSIPSNKNNNKKTRYNFNLQKIKPRLLNYPPEESLLNYCKQFNIPVSEVLPRHVKQINLQDISQINNSRMSVTQILNGFPQYNKNTVELNNELSSAVNQINAMLPVSTDNSEPEEEFILGC